MSNRTLAAVGNFFEVIGSAIAASKAIDSGRAPRARDLVRLGIDPKSFEKLGR